jgi:hypothetical protein
MLLPLVVLGAEKEALAVFLRKKKGPSFCSGRAV